MIFKSKLIRNTFWAASGNGSMAAVSFIASIFVVKNLGPVEFGVLQEMTAYFIVFQNFENIINPNILKRHLIQHPENAHSMIKTVGASISAMGIAFLFLSLTVYFFSGMPTKLLLLAIMLSGMVFRYSNGISFYFDARLETFKSQLSLNIGNLTSSIFKVLASFLNPIGIFQAFAVPIHYMVTMLIHLFQYRRAERSETVSKFDTTGYFALIVLSFPLFISTFVDLFKNRLPFLYLGQTVPAYDLGLFSAGVKLTEPWLFIASALSISFWPKLVRTREESSVKYGDTQTLYFSVVFFFFGALALGGSLFGKFFVSHVLGPEYAGSEIIFVIQSLALLPQGLNVAFGLMEINQGLAKFSLIRNLGALILMLGLLLFYVPRVGVMAGSVAILCSSVFSVFILPLLMQPTRGVAFNMLAAPIRGPRLLLAYLRDIR